MGLFVDKDPDPDLSDPKRPDPYVSATHIPIIPTDTPIFPFEYMFSASVKLTVKKTIYFVIILLC